VARLGCKVAALFLPKSFWNSLYGYIYKSKDWSYIKGKKLRTRLANDSDFSHFAVVDRRRTASGQLMITDSTTGHALYHCIKWPHECLIGIGMRRLMTTGGGRIFPAALCRQQRNRKVGGFCLNSSGGCTCLKALRWRVLFNDHVFRLPIVHGNASCLLHAPSLLWAALALFHKSAFLKEFTV